jgi:hypothetical protein
LMNWHLQCLMNFASSCWIDEFGHAFSMYFDPNFVKYWIKWKFKKNWNNLYCFSYHYEISEIVAGRLDKNKFYNLFTKTNKFFFMYSMTIIKN